MTNETLKNLEERSSCSAFTDKLPEKEKIEAIAKAATQSPSATNAQPWRIVVITNKELIQEMEEETLHMIMRPAWLYFPMIPGTFTQNTTAELQHSLSLLQPSLWV